MPEPALLPPELENVPEERAAGVTASSAVGNGGRSSTPVAGMFNTFERTQEKRSATSTAIAVGIHALVFLLIVLLALKVKKIVAPAKPAVVALVDPMQVPPVKLPIRPTASKSGGGGGSAGPTPPVQGRLPKFEDKPVIVPTVTVDHPKLAVEPAVKVQTDLKMANNNMPDIGMPNSNLKGVFSGGGGSGGGLGSGNGGGLGPGSDKGSGGGVYQVGGSVLPPSVTHQVDAEFSDEARKAKFSGNVLVGLIIGADGVPRSVHVLRPIGMGLDENAVAAVKQWRFRPATKDGKPVAVALNLEVNFQIF